MTYWGDYLIPGTPQADTDGLSIRELRNLYPDMTRRQLREQFPDAPMPGSGMPGGVTKRELRLSIPDPTKYFSQINPQYTQLQPTDSFAPMQMYQQFKSTGQVPGGMSSTAPTAPAAGGAGYSTGGGK